MKYVHTGIWILLIVVLGFYTIQYGYLASNNVSLPIFKLEVANATDGKALLQQLYNTHIGNRTLLRYAQVNTIADFFFIIAYVGVLIILSYAVMQREKHPVLNNLLRMNFLLAIVAGLLDVIEDGILLFDMYDYNDKSAYISSRMPAYAKWLLAVYILLIILISLVNRLLKQGNSTNASVQRT